MPMTTLFRRTPMLLPALLCVAIWPFSTWASEWVASVDERSGLPVLTRGGSPVAASKFTFWGSNWDWTYFRHPVQG